jgi:hypothetical protein
MFSPTEVVVRSGPAGWPFSAPNFVHSRRSATLGSTYSFLIVVLILRVVLTFLPSSFSRHVTIVLVPSGLEVICCGGRADGSSNSSSSAQLCFWL